MKHDNIILKPIVTEKSVGIQAENNRYTFAVVKNASKGAVAKAIEDMYGVNVLDVRTSIMPGKRRRIRGTAKFTKTTSWKKAVVTLKSGQKIDVFTSLMGGEQ